jgi:hypothetical protein
MPLPVAGVVNVSTYDKNGLVLTSNERWEMEDNGMLMS